MPVGVLGLGSYIPDRVVGNAEIGAWSSVTADWIAQRTGVAERRYAPDDSVTSDLAVHAAEQALGGRPGVRERLVALVFATCTPDVPQPATAAILQHKLGITTTPAFDVDAVCSGFLFSIAVADGLLSRRDRLGDHALVVGADMISRIVDRSDPRIVSLFGDGAGAMLLGFVPDGYGFLATRMITEGSLHGIVGVDAGGTRQPIDAAALERGDHLVHMDGRAVRDWVVPTLRNLVQATLDDNRLKVDDIDRFVFHQANGRMLEKFASDLGIAPDRMPSTVARYGNTGCASLPITLHDSHLRKPLRRGERILLAAAGAGLTAAATVLVWY